MTRDLLRERQRRFDTEGREGARGKALCRPRQRSGLCSHSHQSLEEAKKDPPLEPWKGALPTLQLWTSGPRTERESFCGSKPPPLQKTQGTHNTFTLSTGKINQKQQQQQNQTSQTGKAKCGMSIQWNIIQPTKGRRNCHTPPHG